MDALELINIIQPKHDRTSCSDGNLDNGFYSSGKYTRCARCTLLQIIKEGYLPESHEAFISFNIEV